MSSAVEEGAGDGLADADVAAARDRPVDATHATDATRLSTYRKPRLDGKAPWAAGVGGGMPIRQTKRAAEPRMPARRGAGGSHMSLPGPSVTVRVPGAIVSSPSTASYLVFHPLKEKKYDDVTVQARRVVTYVIVCFTISVFLRYHVTHKSQSSTHENAERWAPGARNLYEVYLTSGHRQPPSGVRATQPLKLFGTGGSCEPHVCVVSLSVASHTSEPSLGLPAAHHRP